MKQALSNLALSGLLAITSMGFAQSAAPAATPAQNAPTMHSHQRIDSNAQADRLAKKLKLSSDQENQIKPILADRQQQMQALHQDQSISSQDRRAKAKTLRDDSNSKIEAVLNDTQKQKFDQMLAKRQQRMQNRGQGKNTPASTSPASSPA